jgi:hypothetical protein
MPYNVTLDEGEGIISVVLSAKLTHADHCSVLEEVLQAHQATGSSRVLVDMRDLDTTLSSTVDCFSFGESLAKTVPCARIAHVAPLDAKSRKDVAFTSTVETNRGIICAHFENVDEAKRWLLK